ncbi:MAG: hypothetical protein NT121_03410 [Chloroflexi bacterium]|nr:hypothetical protein [Chloroflexota bacterium]
MIFAIGLLIVFGTLAFRIAPKEKEEDAHVHGAGQIGLLAAIALFGVDYFTSYFYATGEMMSALHPYGLQQYGYIAVSFIALANIVFGALYMYSRLQRRRRFLYRINALSDASTKPRSGRCFDSGLHLHHCCFIAIWSGSVIIHYRFLRHPLVLAFRHRRDTGKRNLVSDHSWPW